MIDRLVVLKVSLLSFPGWGSSSGAHRNLWEKRWGLNGVAPWMIFSGLIMVVKCVLVTMACGCIIIACLGKSKLMCPAWARRGRGPPTLLQQQDQKKPLPVMRWRGHGIRWWWFVVALIPLLLLRLRLPILSAWRGHAWIIRVCCPCVKLESFSMAPGELVLHGRKMWIW